METAALRLGLAGFDAREQSVITDIAARFRTVRWLVGEVDFADAWLVNAARVARVHGSLLRVISTNAAKQVLPIVLDIESRPVAIAICEREVTHRTLPRFDLRRPETLVPVLAEFDRCLHGRKTCYWTAAHLVEHNTTVGKAIFELRADSHLLAVADMKGEVAIWPRAGEKDFDQAAWKHKARKTVAIPEEFERYSLARLIWQYTTRTQRELLPKRYRECDIFFRRPPRIDPQLIEDTHLLVMRELALGPCTLGELQTRLRLDKGAIERALAALYFVGSITSNPERASQTSGRGSLAALPAAEPQPAYGNDRQVPDTRPSTAPLI